MLLKRYLHHKFDEIQKFLKGRSISSPALGGPKVWFCDSVNGSDGGYDGRSMDRAFKTVAKAIAAASAWDTIYINNAAAYTEDLVVPIAKMGLKLIGTPGSKIVPQITSSAAGTTALTIQAPCVEVRNIHFNGASKTAPYILCDRDATSAINCGIAPVIADCYFHGHTSSYSAVCLKGGIIQGKLLRNHFQAFGGAGTGSTYEAAVWDIDPTVACGDWDIIDNWFTENTAHLCIIANNCLVKGNSFLDVGKHDTALVHLDLTGCNALLGGNGGGNIVVGNYFDNTDAELTNAHGYYGNATDYWAGNYATDKVSDGGTVIT